MQRYVHDALSPCVKSVNRFHTDALINKKSNICASTTGYGANFG